MFTVCRKTKMSNVKFFQNLTVETVAGTPNNRGYLDGESRTAKFTSPKSICYVSKSNYYLIAEKNTSVRIWMNGSYTTHTNKRSK